MDDGNWNDDNEGTLWETICDSLSQLLSHIFFWRND